MNEELSFTVENEVVNRSTEDGKPQAEPMFPEEIGVIFGLDHCWLLLLSHNLSHKVMSPCFSKQIIWCVTGLILTYSPSSSFFTHFCLAFPELQ
jgi:hypothetical protein